ncbi:MAG: diaminopimelate epimerase [Proteobacteria bacterium]|nr:diaminopimelate epimerase [Pseudomonadota bacterium]
MPIPFTKMQGLGNDFVVFDGVSHHIDLSSEQFRWIAHRRFGVGCDQILVVERAEKPDVDFRFRIYNADGSEAEQCGNGARCIARFARDRGLTQKDEIIVESLAGVSTLRLEASGEVTVEMGIPEFDPANVPFAAKTPQIVYDLEIDGKQIQVSVLSLGNPHAVQIVDDIDNGLVESQGPLIESHPRFPRRVNAGFMKVVDRRHVHLRVHERGVGETLACGSGAGAAVVVGCRRGLLDDTVQVTLPGGAARVAWAGEGEPVLLTGPAVTTYEGTIEVADLL